MKIKTIIITSLIFSIGCLFWLQNTGMDKERVNKWVEINGGELFYDTYPYLEFLPENIIDFINGTFAIKLNLAKTKINDLEKLHPLTNLEILDLHWSTVKDISAIKYMRNLREINFELTHIKNIDSLANLQKLERLNLNSTGIKDVRVLFKLRSLKWIDLSGVSLKKETVEELQRALPNCVILR